MQSGTLSKNFSADFMAGHSGSTADFDRRHLWHPYTSPGRHAPSLEIVSAAGVRLHLADGRELIDGMSSWWCAIHGYRHPVLDRAAAEQLQRMAHVMFGGLTHEPAARLGQLLLNIVPGPMEQVFFCDSGSVAVEAAIKMALQYYLARGEGGRNRLLSVRGGYHGDTFGAMAVCDPLNGMHSRFRGALSEHFFAPVPAPRFGKECREQDIAAFRCLLETHRETLAAVILEPIVQGAGGMRFYSAGYLRRVRELCDRHRILLILDEIATGFGRTGRMFACEHAGIHADILCLGKALTGGYLSLAATLCSARVADTIAADQAGPFMHGPTFMANPLACAVAAANLRLLMDSPWQERILAMETQLRNGLEAARNMPGVNDVRCLGGIGVVELQQQPDAQALQHCAAQHGVWLRPFGRLLYTMPPYIASPAELEQIIDAINAALAQTVQQ